MNNVDKTELAIAQVRDLSEVQIESMRHLMERDAKFDDLLDKVNVMEEETASFKNKVLINNYRRLM